MENTEKKVIRTALDLRREIEKFSLTLKDKTVDELKALEQEYIDIQDKNDEVVKNTNFTLPTKGYKAAAEAIIYFLNKQTVQWQHAAMMINQINFWEKHEKEISYPMLDYTLNMLGSLQFTGKAEWEKVIAIDKFITPIKEQYGDIRTNLYVLSEKHNAIMEALGLVEPFTGDNNPGALTN